MDKKTEYIGDWNARTFSSEWQNFELNLTPYIDRIGQYEINFQLVSYEWEKEWGLEFKDWEIEVYGNNKPYAIEKLDNTWTFRITRSQQTDNTDDFPTILRMKVRSKPGKTLGNIELKKIVFE